MISRDTARQKTREFADLDPDWNSYGAYPIAPLAIENALALINDGPDLIMHVCPLPSGGVQIEYLPNGVDEVEAEIECRADGTYAVLLIHRKYSERDDLTLDQLDAEMRLWHRGWAAALKSRE